MKTLFSWLITIAIAVVIFIGIRHFWGETKITAEFANESIEGAMIYVDGRKIGQTPYVGKLPIGHSTIKIVPPDGYETKEREWTWEFFSTALGIDIHAKFEPLEYEVVEVAPE